MSSESGKKRLLTRWEKIFLAIALIILLYFTVTKLGIRMGKVVDDTEIIDPYKD